MARKKPIIVDDKPKAPRATFIKRDPVPEVITEPYLVSSLDEMCQELFKDTYKSMSVITKMNKLLDKLGSSLHVFEGCGAKYIRDALAVITEEYNKNGSK